MRIIDKRKDYYDSAQALGTDPSIMYVREQKEIKGPKHPHWNHDDTKFAVGFCGGIYFGYRFLVDRVTGGHYSCYDIEDADRFYEEHRKEKLAEYHGETPDARIKRSHRRCRTKPTSPRDYLRLWFQGVVYKWQGEESVKYPDYFQEHKTPVWLYDHGNDLLTINPLLNRWDFFRVKDPYLAYNELSNYVGGVLQQPMKPIPVPADEVMAEIKGFDKFSFRKDPKIRK